MTSLRLDKREKLRGKTRVDGIFVAGTSVIAYPLRAVFMVERDTGGETAAVRFLVSIPKKKIRHAVDRVLLRRRTREAYRLNRHLLLPALHEAGARVDVAFCYLSRDLAPYEVINAKMQHLLGIIARAATTPSHETAAAPHP